MDRNKVFDRLLKDIPKEDLKYQQKQMEVASLLFGTRMTPSLFLKIIKTQRTTENMWLRLSAFTQTLLRKASHILKRCVKFIIE